MSKGHTMSMLFIELYQGMIVICLHITITSLLRYVLAETTERNCRKTCAIYCKTSDAKNLSVKILFYFSKKVFFHSERRITEAEI